MRLPHKYQTRWVYAATAAISASICNALPLTFTLDPESLLGYSFPISLLPAVVLSTFLAGLLAWQDQERWWGDSFSIGIKTVALSFFILGVEFALIFLAGMLREQGCLGLILAGFTVLAIFIAIPLLWIYFDHSRWSGFYFASGISLIIIALLFFLFRHMGFNFFIMIGGGLYMLAFIPAATLIFGSFLTLGIPYLIGGTISLLFTSHDQADITPSPK